MPSARATSKIDRRITQDLAKVEAAIQACTKAETNPFFADIREAVALEKSRLFRMLNDRRLMWNTYRRRDKGAPYYQGARVQSEKAA
jgi:hypothetical protein